MKDLILGAISANYTVDDVRNWAHSIIKSGFDGDVAVFCYNFIGEDATIPNFLQDLGFSVFLPTYNNWGQNVPFFEHHSGKGTPTTNHELVHQIRFFHFWHYLKELDKNANEYRYVIVTDVRDVVFQYNPSNWLDIHDDKIDGSTIVAPSENILYRDESWNLQMIKKHYGPYVVEYLLKDRPVCNVGTIAARFHAFMGLCINIYQSSLGIHPAQLPMPGDQTGFNFLINTVYINSSRPSSPSTLWSCQCGTMCDPTKQHLFEHHIEELDIGITDEGIVTNFGKPFCILHQYDRVPQFLDKVNRRYGELNEANSS